MPSDGSHTYAIAVGSGQRSTALISAATRLNDRPIERDPAHEPAKPAHDYAPWRPAAAGVP